MILDHSIRFYEIIDKILWNPYQLYRRWYKIFEKIRKHSRESYKINKATRSYRILQNS